MAALERSLRVPPPRPVRAHLNHTEAVHPNVRVHTLITSALPDCRYKLFHLLFNHFHRVTSVFRVPGRPRILGTGPAYPCDDDVIYEMITYSRGITCQDELNEISAKITTEKGSSLIKVRQVETRWADDLVRIAGHRLLQVAQDRASWKTRKEAEVRASDYKEWSLILLSTARDHVTRELRVPAAAHDPRRVTAAFLLLFWRFEFKFRRAKMSFNTSIGHWLEQCPREDQDQHRSGIGIASRTRIGTKNGSEIVL
ncbi:hypothetical protein EVAR_85250_1 [Eumeta japonica]|uniref:Uncharacterized protein n=1 Tax=Eumeta variegata TaxID=151549 RepID=A0A4C1VXU9_EUMVA|nr:hypothetical protein EVAR_85250_1 [Eumeta japonica]